MDANDPKFQQIKELLLCPIGFRMRKLRCSMWQSSGHCPCLLPLLLLSSELWHRKSTDGTLYRLTLIPSWKNCSKIAWYCLFVCFVCLIWGAGIWSLPLPPPSTPSEVWAVAQKNHKRHSLPAHIDMKSKKDSILSWNIFQ